MEDSLRRLLFVAKKLLTQWRGRIQYFTTEDRMILIQRAVFRRTVLIQRAVVEKMVQKIVSYSALLP